MRIWVFLLALFFSATGLYAQTPAPVLNYPNNIPAYRIAASRIAASLDDSALAAQVLLTGIEGRVTLSSAMRSLLERVPAGGIMLFRYNLDTSKDDVKKLLSETVSLVSVKTGIPPFMAVDHEGGLVHRFGEGVGRLPSAYSFWELAQAEGRPAALASAERLYRVSAEELRGLGITMVLGPVAEILDRDNQKFLETRSYGPDPAFTQDASSAYIRSMGAAGIASVIKHFPGNSAADPHTGASSLRAGKATLNEMVRPFSGIISRLSPPALMLSHVIVPALDERLNASLSSRVINDWLRLELGFDGIIIADDFSMAAIAASGLSPTAAAVTALNAGVDMIMTWPSSLTTMHLAILDALRSGRLPKSRLLEAAERIIAEKIRFGLMALPSVPAASGFGR